MTHLPRRSALLATLIALCALVTPASALAFSKVAMERLSPYFTEDAVLRADAYVAPLRAASIVEMLIWLAVVGAFLCLGWGRALKHRCDAWAESLAARVRAAPLRRLGAVLSTLWGDASWGGALLFTFLYLAIFLLLFLPSDFYFGWWRERQHGLSVQSLSSWMWDAFKGWGIECASMSALTFGLFGLARRKRRWWLWLGIPCSILLLGAGALDPYRVQVFRDYEPLPDGPTRRAIAGTLVKAGVEFEEVMVLKMREVSTRVNAFIAGQGPSRRIVLWDTLVAAMTPQEVANAVAHELGHLKDRSTWRLIGASLAFTPLLWLVAVMLRLMGKKRRFGFEDDRDVACLPALFLFVWLFGFVSTPFSSAQSRSFERRADAYALELLGEPEAFRSMMVKLAALNSADLRPPLWVQVRMSHPLVVERIEHAERFAGQKGIALSKPSPALFALPDDFRRRMLQKAAGASGDPIASP